jgi:hypothetical protein
MSGRVLRSEGLTECLGLIKVLAEWIEWTIGLFDPHCERKLYDRSTVINLSIIHRFVFSSIVHRSTVAKIHHLTGYRCQISRPDFFEPPNSQQIFLSIAPLLSMQSESQKRLSVRDRLCEVRLSLSIAEWTQPFQDAYD